MPGYAVINSRRHQLQNLISIALACRFSIETLRVTSLFGAMMLILKDGMEFDVGLRDF